MSQWTALSFVPPMNGKPLPMARWIVPSIFSSKSVLRMCVLDSGVAADPELAEHGRALVHRQHLLEEVLVSSSAADLNGSAVLEAQTRAVDVASVVVGGVLREGHEAVGGVLHRE